MSRFFTHSILLSFIIILWSTSIQAQHPRLLFSADDIGKLKEKAQSETGEAIVNQLKKRLAEEPDPLWVASYAAGHAFLYLLQEDSVDLQLSQSFAVSTINDSIPFQSTSQKYKGSLSIPLWNSDYKAIYRIPNLVGLALAYDLMYSKWPDTFRQMIGREIAEKAAELIKGGGVGYNPSPWSNWQGITKGGAGFAALAIVNDLGMPDSIEDMIALAGYGLKEHLDYLGDKGWTPEGFDYLRYELNTGVFPFLQAYQHIYREPFYAMDKVGSFLPFYVMQGVVKDRQLFSPMYGLGGNQWNVNRWRSGDWVMGMGITPDKYLPAILWTFDQVFGLQGDKTFDIYKPHDAIFALLNYPMHITSENPESILAKIWEDHKGGYYIFRNQWKDQNDIVITITNNRLAKPASHSHKEAGSFRIFGLGHQWATRPKKNKDLTNQKFENRVYIEDASSWLGAETIHFSKDKDGSASITFDMDSAYYAGEKLKNSFDIGVKATRSLAVDFNSKSGAEAVILVQDLMNAQQVKTWVMHTDQDDVLVDKNSFTIQNAGAALKGYFLYPENPELKHFPENKEITAKSPDHFQVVMILGNGLQSMPKIKGKGLFKKVRLSDRTYFFKKVKILLK